MWELAEMHSWLPPMAVWVPTIPYLGTSGRAADSLYLYCETAHLPALGAALTLSETGAALLWNVTETAASRVAAGQPAGNENSVVLSTASGAPHGWHPDKAHGGAWTKAGALEAARAELAAAVQGGLRAGGGGTAAAWLFTAALAALIAAATLRGGAFARRLSDALSAAFRERGPTLSSSSSSSSSSGSGSSNSSSSKLLDEAAAAQHERREAAAKQEAEQRQQQSAEEEVSLPHGLRCGPMRSPARAYAPTPSASSRAGGGGAGAGGGGGGARLLLPCEPPHEVSDVDEAQALFARAAAEDRLLVVDFYADWCGPCQNIKPAFEEMALATPRALFAKVNTDKAKQLAGAAGVRSLPTFQLFRRGVKVDEMSGADPAALRSMINAAIAAGDAATAAGAGDADLGMPADCASVVERCAAPRLGDGAAGADGARLGLVFRKLASLDAALRSGSSGSSGSGGSGGDGFPANAATRRLAMTDRERAEVAKLRASLAREAGGGGFTEDEEGGSGADADALAAAAAATAGVGAGAPPAAAAAQVLARLLWTWPSADAFAPLDAARLLALHAESAAPLLAGWSGAGWAGGNGDAAAAADTKTPPMTTTTTTGSNKPKTTTHEKTASKSKRKPAAKAIRGDLLAALLAHAECAATAQHPGGGGDGAAAAAVVAAAEEEEADPAFARSADANALRALRALGALCARGSVAALLLRDPTWSRLLTGVLPRALCPSTAAETTAATAASAANAASVAAAAQRSLAVQRAGAVLLLHLCVLQSEAERAAAAAGGGGGVTGSLPGGASACCSARKTSLLALLLMSLQRCREAPAPEGETLELLLKAVATGCAGDAGACKLARSLGFDGAVAALPLLSDAAQAAASDIKRLVRWVPNINTAAIPNPWA